MASPYGPVACGAGPGRHAGGAGPEQRPVLPRPGGLCGQAVSVMGCPAGALFAAI
jgi:hypothetical protein